MQKDQSTTTQVSPVKNYKPTYSGNKRGDLFTSKIFKISDTKLQGNLVGYEPFGGNEKRMDAFKKVNGYKAQNEGYFLT